MKAKKKKKIIKQTKPLRDKVNLIAVILIIKMGNTSVSTQFKSGKWKKLETIGNRQVLENIQTHIQVQKHFAMSDFKSFDDRFKNTEVYNWRKSLPESTHLVKLYDYEIKQERFGIQEDQYVYTEKIHRLNQKAKTFSKPQAFLLILDLLTGLDVLFQSFGLFNVDVFLLGLSESGRGKVWVNQNYARNSIDETNAIETQNQTNELVVVNNLIRLVRDKVYNDTFMPEIQFPSNVYLKAAIQYLKNVRRDHPLFRVDKVYLNRNLFKQYYDTLWKQHTKIIQQITQPNPNTLNLQTNVLNSQFSQNMQTLTGQQELKLLQRQKSVSFMKVKNEPSQTLSSDSNSRSKKPTNSTLPLSDFPKQEHPQIHHGKIHLKDIIEKQRVSTSLNQAQNTHNNQFPSMGNNFVPNEKILNPIKPTGFQQRPFIPTFPINNAPQSHQTFQQKVQENRALQFNKIPMVPINQFPQQFKGQQLIQRKVVEYRPLNNEERHNIQHLIGSSTNNNQMFSPIQNISMPQNQRSPVQPIQRQTFHPHSQTLPFAVVNRPMEPETVQSQKMGFNNVIPRRITQPREEQEQFINNVQLCQSVVFDRGQIEQNMADL